MSQQGLDFSKKSVKEKYSFDLTYTDVHMGRQKVKNLNLEEGFLLLSFFDNFNF